MPPLVDLKISGQQQLERALDRMAAGFSRQVMESQKDAADLVEGVARPRVPVLTGAAQGSIRVRVSGRAVSVIGGQGVPYFAWLEFGGRVGRGGGVVRRRVRDGRYIIAGFIERERDVEKIMEENVIDLAARSGLRAT